MFDERTLMSTKAFYKQKSEDIYTCIQYLQTLVFREVIIDLLLHFNSGWVYAEVRDSLASTTTISL